MASLQGNLQIGFSLYDSQNTSALSPRPWQRIILIHMKKKVVTCDLGA